MIRWDCCDMNQDESVLVGTIGGEQDDSKEGFCSDLGNSKHVCRLTLEIYTLPSIASTRILSNLRHDENMCIHVHIAVESGSFAFRLRHDVHQNTINHNQLISTWTGSYFAPSLRKTSTAIISTSSERGRLSIVDDVFLRHNLW